MVVSDELYSIQSFCNKFLGFCPFISGEEKELRKILNKNGYKFLRDYPLRDIEQVIKDKVNVALVDATYINNKCEITLEYRWVEVPEDVI